MNQYIQAKGDDYQKAIEFYKKEISSIRTGRANPSIFEGVQIEAYGAKTPLNGLANINVSDAQSMTVAPWDKNVLKDIEKAIVEADLGVGVVNEGDIIRVSIPKMTEENRKDLVKKLNEKTEKARITFRQIREEIKDDIEKAEKNKEVSEDEKFQFIKELDEETRKKNDEIEEIRKKKEEDILTV